MKRPRGVLSHHKFQQLFASPVHNNLVLGFDAAGQYTFPDAISKYLPHLQAYWQEKGLCFSGELQSVCITGAVEWHSVANERFSRAELLLTCCPAMYWQFLCSNLSLDMPLPDGKTLRQYYDQGVFGKFMCRYSGPLFEGTGKMFGFPVLGNCLGITVSLVTVDKKFIVTQRSTECEGVSHDHGNWQCAVGTQVKRHEARFLDSNGVPCPALSAIEGLVDEMGEEVANNSFYPFFQGLVFRDDYVHCELLYEVDTTLTAQEVMEAWHRVPVRRRCEIERIEAIDMHRPDRLIEHLADQRNRWSPQHAAGALNTLDWKFRGEIAEYGF